MNLDSAFKVKGYDQLDLWHEEGSSKSIDVEKNKIKKVEEDFSQGVGVRVIVGKKIGFAYTTDMSKLKETVKNAIAIAKHANQNLNLEKFNKYPKVSGIFDKKLVSLQEDAAIDSLNQSIDLVKRNKMIMTFGSAAYSNGKTVYMNSFGTHLEEETTSWSEFASINYKGADGWWDFSSNLYENNLLKTTQKAIDFAKLASVKKKIKTQKADVIFHPIALSSILSNGLYPSLNSDAVQKKQSKLAGKLGQKIFSDKLTFVDDGIKPEGANTAAFARDGVPCQKLTLVEKGTLKNFIYDLVRAQKEDKKSTGAASRSYNSNSYPTTSNFTISPGNVKDVVSQIDKGLLGYAFLNTHSINDVTGDFSLGSYTSFWVEKGEIKFMPRQAMISGNVFDLLKNVSLIGKKIENEGGFYAPLIVSETQIIGE
jgi:PmbA protein